MATLSRGQTLGATETITNTKLHNLVDLGSVTSIVNADIDPSANIEDTKIADITTGGKVRGTAILNLPSIPSGAGVIPIANIPVLGSTYASLVSIPNTSLLPLTLTSWVDAGAMRNLGSMPSLAGQLPWYSISASLASGSSIRFDGTSRFVGGSAGALALVSNTSISTATNSGDITINSTKYYMVVVNVYSFSGAEYLSMLVNNDSSGNDYQYTLVGRDSGGNAIAVSQTSQNDIALTGTLTTDATRTRVIIYIFPDESGGLNISGESWYKTSTGITVANHAARYGGGTPTSFRIKSSSSATFSGNVVLYEIGT